MSQPLTGTAQSYSYPLTSGLLDHIGQAGSVGQWAQNMAGPQAQQAQMSQTPPDYTALALQLAGNPHAGPYSTAGNLVQPGSATNPSAGSTTGGSTGSSVAGGLLGALAKNPSLVKDGVQAVQGLLGGAPALSPFASEAASATASELGSAAAPALAADTAAALTPVIGAAPTAAELGTTADALAPLAVAPAAPAATAAATPAATGMLGAGAGAAAALGIAALPALLAAFVPDSAELTPSKIAGMENEVTAATQANGGLLGAAYSQNPNGTVNPAHYQTLADLMTLESENPQEFAKAGGTGPITQYLQSQGYSPINWKQVSNASGAGYNTGNRSGKQL